MRCKKPITRQLHNFKDKFESVPQMKAHVITGLKDELPQDPSLDIGYFEGRQSSKVWLVSAKNLDSMYRKAKNGSELLLWMQCLQDVDEDNDDLEPEKKRKKSSELLLRHQEKEEEVEAIYSEFRSKHYDYTVPQLKLWARMIHCGTHDDYEDPPCVPMIIGIPPKRQRKDSLAVAISGAAEAVAKVFAPLPAS